MFGDEVSEVWWSDDEVSEVWWFGDVEVWSGCEEQLQKHETAPISGIWSYSPPLCCSDQVTDDDDDDDLLVLDLLLLYFSLFLQFSGSISQQQLFLCVERKEKEVK